MAKDMVVFLLGKRRYIYARRRRWYAQKSKLKSEKDGDKKICAEKRMAY
jgi:hypothetical protein